MTREGLPTVWLLVDDRTGNRSQCLGVAEALGWPYTVRELRYSALGGLPNALLGASFSGLTRASRSGLAPPWPDVVVAAGRRTAPVARRLKALTRGAAFLVQIMFPGRTGSKAFDLIAVPRHDRPRPGANVVAVTGAPHGVTAERLRAEAERWRGTLEVLPRPRIALIVGGSTRRRRFTGAMARELSGVASAMAAAAGGSLFVSTSRRTGDATEPLLAGLDVPHHAYRWDNGGANPYHGYLALADAVIVTGESVSMCSEACAVPAPVYIYAPKDLITEKHARLHGMLYDGGYARPLPAGGEAPRLETWTHPPLSAAAEVARGVRRRMRA